MEATSKVSIDIGNGYVKAVNERGETLHFPTVLKENQGINVLGKSDNPYDIEIDGESFYIGDLALAKRGTRQWQNDRAFNTDTPKYIALCCHLLTDQTNPEVNLCLGLPYSYYLHFKKGERLIAELSGREIKTVYKDTAKTITIARISVFPQGVGAYFANLYDIGGQPIVGAEENIRAIFIDIGYRTVDIVAFELLGNTFELLEDCSASLEECGISSAISDIADCISKVGSREINTNEVESAIQNNNSRINDMYGQIDFTKEESQAYNKLAKHIITSINQKMGVELRRHSKIFLTGGGASKLYPYMQATYSNIMLQDDYIYCNAKGYLALENTKNNNRHPQQ